jgi:cysteine desulfurase
VLFLKKGIEIEPLVHGGGQESGRRSGTENIAAIVGFAEALKLVEKNKTKNLIKARKIMSYFWKRLKTTFPEVILHGAEIDSDTRLPNIINIAFKGMEAEKLLLYLDKYGIMCSTGSACSLRNNEGSHVLKELGLELDEIKNSLRFSFSSNTSLKDFQHIIQALQIILKTII